MGPSVVILFLLIDINECAALVLIYPTPGDTPPFVSIQFHIENPAAEPVMILRLFLFSFYFIFVSFYVDVYRRLVLTTEGEISF